MRRQLTSPAPWLIVALFAVLAGGAFVVNLNAFLDLSAEALSAPPLQPINVNQLLLRPFLFKIGMAALLVLPLITARAYTRDRGVINRQVVVATFVEALSLYAVMLVFSLVLVAVLFLYGTPEWGPIVSGYLGLFLMGAAFISFALFISSLATGAIAAGAATFAISLMLIYFSVGEALDDFAKGVVDTGHVVSCLAIIALGLFLTLHARPPQQPAS